MRFTVTAMLSFTTAAEASMTQAKPPGRLAMRRLAAGLTQEQVSKAIEARAGRRLIARDVLSRIENGTTWPSPSAIKALAAFYSTTPGQIFEEMLEAWDAAHREGAP
jgi:transcriptional regulator with XRE-family HTH domain